MKKKKLLLVLVGVILLLLFLIAAIVGFKGRNANEDKRNLQYVKEKFLSDMQDLKAGKYQNLLSTGFNSSIERIEGIYNLEILIDNSSENGTLLERFKVREEVVDKFFQENFDKSFLIQKIYLTMDDKPLEISYNDVEKELSSGKYDDAVMLGTLIGNNKSEGGYMVQVSYNRLHTWLSKKGLGTIHPSAMGEFKSINQYLMGDRQGDDAKIQLKDGEILLSKVEKTALEYLNSDKFPLVRADGISFTIGEARIIETENYEGVCFLTRRVYKGIPFEYGSNAYTEAYNDKLGHDGGEISYIESDSPDTMLGFHRTDGVVVEKKEITEMLTAGEALGLLSEQIGENSVYEVHGVELVYRNCEVPEDKIMEISDILEPKWKIITINQNDDKYTLFYVDVVTGEITNRFEYYYD